MMVLVSGCLITGAIWAASGPTLGAQQGPPITDVSTGGSPLAVAVDPLTDVVYSANSHSGTVSVIDGKLDVGGQPNPGKVIATVHVHSQPWGVAVDPRTDMIYVTNQGSNDVSVIDGRTDKVVATVGVGMHPVGVGVVDATDIVYVANQGPARSLSTVSVIDGRTNKLIKALPVGISPFGVGVDQLTRRVYVANQYGQRLGADFSFVGTVSVIAGTNVLASVPVGPNNAPMDVAVDGITNRVYVSTSVFQEGSSVVVINAATNRALDQITVPDPQGVAVDATTDTVYVAEGYDNDQGANLYVIDGKEGEVAKVVAVGYNPWGVAVDPTTDRVYLANDVTPGVVTVVSFKGYLVPAPPLEPTTIVPEAPASTTPATTVPPHPTTTVPNIPSAPASTWCGLLEKGGGEALFSGIDNGKATIGSNGPLTGTVACTEDNGAIVVVLGPSSTEAAFSPTPTKPLPALGAHAGLWVAGRYVEVWWPRQSGWVELQVECLVGQTLPEIQKGIVPAALAVAQKVHALIG